MLPAFASAADEEASAAAAIGTSCGIWYMKSCGLGSASGAIGLRTTPQNLVGMVHPELLGPVLAELRQTALRSGRHAPRNDHGVAPAVTGAARWAGRRLVDAGEQTGLWRVGTGNLLTARGTGSRSASMARLRIRRGRGPRARTRPSAARAHRRSQTGASKGHLCESVAWWRLQAIPALQGLGNINIRSS